MISPTLPGKAITETADDNSLTEPWEVIPRPQGTVVCALTGEVMTDPVRALDGYAYNAPAIRAWFKLCHAEPISPVTGGLLASDYVLPDLQTRAAIAAWGSTLSCEPSAPPMPGTSALATGWPTGVALGVPVALSPATPHAPSLPPRRLDLAPQPPAAARANHCRVLLADTVIGLLRQQRDHLDSHNGFFGRSTGILVTFAGAVAGAASGLGAAAVNPWLGLAVGFGATTLAAPAAGQWAARLRHDAVARTPLMQDKLAVLRQIEWSLAQLSHETQEERDALAACRDAIAYFRGDQLTPYFDIALMGVGLAVGAACLVGVLVMAAAIAAQDSAPASAGTPADAGGHHHGSGGGRHHAHARTTSSDAPSPPLFVNICSAGGRDVRGAAASQASSSSNPEGRTPRARMPRRGSNYLERLPMRASWEEVLTRQR